ncbi:(2Fe-2S)-binding protein [uncultured Methylovirgula sp.]|uniref:(2Fe-2S)-binding protein n=1 Tax=uncultured Methylovirgula sp. TaxID=1285960 RepID=UPI00263671EB|nr:(2Fe-2S)-binding protein [uncultured Methylovirgula sp.]
MIVCSCNAISDTSVKASIHSEKCPRTPGAVYRCLGCKPCCGRCFATVRAIIEEATSRTGEMAAVGTAQTSVARLDEHRHAHDAGHVHEDCDGGCEACAAAAA